MNKSAWQIMINKNRINRRMKCFQTAYMEQMNQKYHLEPFPHRFSANLQIIPPYRVMIMLKIKFHLSKYSMLPMSKLPINIFNQIICAKMKLLKHNFINNLKK